MTHKPEPRRPKTTEWTEYEFASDVSLAEVLELVAREKRTGELRVYVNQGGARSIVWKQRKK